MKYIHAGNVRHCQVFILMCVIYLPMSLGRIMNRFTKDIGNLDEYLPLTMFDTLDIGLRIFGTIIIVLTSNYYFIVPAIVLLYAYWFIRSFFLTCSRGIKRVETISKFTGENMCHSHILRN